MPALGRLQVSPIALGCNNFGQRCDADQAAAVVGAALDEGVTFFDTADIYGDTQSEVMLGAALRGRRDEVAIGTKFGLRWGSLPGGARPEQIRGAAEASLRRLDTDRIDLYQLHFPGPPGLPEAVPFEDILGELDRLVQEGKVIEVGCANFGAPQLLDADNAARNHRVGAFRTVQSEYSLLHREPEQELLPTAIDLGVAFLPYYPLASGLLTGKYRRDEDMPADSRLSTGWTAWANNVTPEVFDIVEQLATFAERRDRTLLELALSWLFAQPGVDCVTVGARTPEQLRANVAAAQWQLNHDDLEAVDAITTAPVVPA